MKNIIDTFFLDNYLTNKSANNYLCILFVSKSKANYFIKLETKMK